MPKTNNHNSTLTRKWLIVPLLAAILIALIAVVAIPDEYLHVSFLNVGQGDAILNSQGRQQILVDGGPSPRQLNLELSRKMAFWDRSIDLVVLTHPSADHITGLIDVLQRYQVEQVLYPDPAFNSATWDEWLRILEEKNITRTIARAGQEISFGKTKIQVLNPQSPPLAGTGSDVNNNGVVLRVSRGQASFLLTADIQWETEFDLITRRAGLTSTILKIAHHGSNTSTTSDFVAVVNPQLAVISVGTDTKFGQPSSELLTLLEKRLGAGSIYRTDKRGTIEFTTDGERLWVKSDTQS
ncbi:MAG: MBL fold metallo-hydrolase [Dehalococcoidales bacterium]|nr:MBL fold metallo-hydrolase [Dehalococcoidales bacterium]